MEVAAIPPVLAWLQLDIEWFQPACLRESPDWTPVRALRICRGSPLEALGSWLGKCVMLKFPSSRRGSGNPNETSGKEMSGQKNVSCQRKPHPRIFSLRIQACSDNHFVFHVFEHIGGSRTHGDHREFFAKVQPFKTVARASTQPWSTIAFFFFFSRRSTHMQKDHV